MDSIAAHILNPDNNPFVVGYNACCDVFFPQGENTPDDYNPFPITNPFPEGTREWQGFEEAWYDLTQK